MTKITLFTDGSSSPVKKTGGWAFCLTETPKEPTTIHSDNGGAINTTNNRMEMVAVINGLSYIYANMPNIREVDVMTDSQYVIDPIYFETLNEWRNSGYEKINYFTGEWEEVMNADLWEEIWQLLKRYRFRRIGVNFKWVKGHEGNFHNELCDQMAKAGRMENKVNKLYA